MSQKTHKKLRRVYKDFANLLKTVKSTIASKLQFYEIADNSKIDYNAYYYILEKIIDKLHETIPTISIDNQKDIEMIQYLLLENHNVTIDMDAKVTD